MKNICLFLLVFGLVSEAFAGGNSCSATGDPGCGISCEGSTPHAVCINGMLGYLAPGPNGDLVYYPGGPGICYCYYYDDSPDAIDASPYSAR